MPAGNNGQMGTLDKHGNGTRLTSLNLAIAGGQALYTEPVFYSDVGIQKFGSALYSFTPSIPEAVVDIVPDVRVGGRLTFTLTANIPGGAPADTILTIWVSEAQLTATTAGTIAALAHCGIIFVSKCGDDTDPGTILRPKLTVQGALTEAAGLVPPPSATVPILIMVAPGEYQENIVLEPFVGITSWETGGGVSGIGGETTIIGNGTTNTITTQLTAGLYQMSNLRIESEVTLTAPGAGNYAVDFSECVFGAQTFVQIIAVFIGVLAKDRLVLDQVDFLTTAAASPQRKMTVTNGICDARRIFLGEDGTLSYRGDVAGVLDSSMILGSDRAAPFNQSIEMFDTGQLALTNNHVSGDIFTTSGGGLTFDDQSAPLNSNYIYQGQVMTATIIAPGTDFVENDIIPGAPSGADGIVRRAVLTVPGTTNVLDVQFPDPTTATPLGTPFAGADVIGPGSISGSNATIAAPATGLEVSNDILRAAGDPSTVTTHVFGKEYFDTTNDMWYKQTDFPSGDTWQVI